MNYRLATAAVGLPILLTVVWIGPPWFSAFLFIVTIAATIELTRLARLWGDRIHWAFPMLIALSFVLSGNQWAAEGQMSHADVLSFFWEGSEKYVIIATHVIMLCGYGIITKRLVIQQDPRFPIPGDSMFFAIPFYVGAPMMYALALRGADQGFEWMLLTLLTVFATDTAAFFGGRTFGKTPLAPNVSPNKTREGAIIGMFAAVITCVVAATYLKIDAIMWETLILGAIIGLFAQLGDLVESRMKRKAGVKDSGFLIPGHGGILDRLDSIVFTMPAVYYFVVWVIQQKGLLS